MKFIGKDIDNETLGIFLGGVFVGLLLTLPGILAIRGSGLFCQGLEYYLSANKSLEIQNQELKTSNEELARVKESLAIENGRLRAQMESGLQVEEEQKALDTRKKELDRREQKINEREESLEEREKVIYSKEQDLFDSVGEQREEVGKAKQIQEDISLYVQRYDDCLQKNEDLRNAFVTGRVLFFIVLCFLILAIIFILRHFSSNSNRGNFNKPISVNAETEENYNNRLKDSDKKALEGDNQEEDNSDN